MTHVLDAPRRGGRRRWILALVLGLLIVVGLLVAVLAFGGLRARPQLVAASANVEAMRAALLAGDTEKALIEVAAAQDHAKAARALTHGPAWSIAGSLPFIGRTPRLISTSTDAAAIITAEALPPLVESSSVLTAAGLTSDGGLSVDVGALSRAAQPIQQADDVLQTQRARLDAVPTAGVPSALTGPFDELRDSVAQVAGLTGGLTQVAQVAPKLLGIGATKRYLVAVQTPAEARGTGGLLGAYAVVEASEGRLSLVRTGPRSDLDPSNQSAPRIDLGADYPNLWGNDPGWWVNANVSPHYPFAAQIWRDLAGRAGLGRIDGVVATDPVALAELMKVTGPVTVGGRAITADTLVPLVTKDVYAQIPTDDAARDAYLQKVASAVLSSVFSGRGDTADWLDAVGRMAQERRVLLWSTDAQAQSVIADSAVGGSVPDGAAAGANGKPYAFVVVNNTAATKLDTYLKRTVEYRGGTCQADSRASTLTIGLSNEAPAGLPPYVVTRSDAAAAGRANGDNRVLVSSYLSTGASVVSATLDGKPLQIASGTERGHPVVSLPLELQRGRTHTVVLTLREPRSTGPARLDVQPLVRDQKSVVDVGPC